MIINYLCLISCLFASCSFPEPSRQETAEERFDRERIVVVHGALRKFIKSMETKGYHAAGIGEGLDHSQDREKEKQNYLGVTFDIKCLPSIDFARKIEVEALQEFQKYINEEEGIQDYVAEYPYPVKFLSITFISKIRDQNLCMVTNNSRDEIYYLKDEPGKPLAGPLIEVHRESYEDAVGILEQQKSKQTSFFHGF
jgi:hypothetical protein